MSTRLRQRLLFPISFVIASGRRIRQLLPGLGHGVLHQTGESEQSQSVGQHHQVVERIGQLPNQIVAGDGAQEHEHQCHHGIDLDDLLAEGKDPCGVCLKDLKNEITN